MNRSLLLFPLLSCAAPHFTTSSATLAPVFKPTPSAVLAVTRVPTPWFAPRALVRRKLVQAVPEYEALAGLQQKAFVLADAGTFGGLYLWTDRAHADGWFSPAWHDRVKARYGGGDVELYDVVSSFEGHTKVEARHLDDRAFVFPLTATLVSAPGADPEAFASSLEVPPGLVRGWVVRASDGTPAVVSWWADRLSAEHAWPEERVRSLGARVEWFEAPVVIDAPR